MPLDDVLDDGEAKPGAAHSPRAQRIDSVETFGQPRQVFSGDTFRQIGHRQPHDRRFAAVRGFWRRTDSNR